MTLTIAGIEFDYHDYDERGDTLFLSVGAPRERPPAEASETPEGHVVEYGEDGSIVAVELLNVRWMLDREGEVTLTCPEQHHLASATLAPALIAA